MKKILSKFKKYSFWVAFAGVVVIFLKNLASLIGFDVDTGVVENVIMSLCGVFVVLGVVTKDTNSLESVETNESVENNVDDEKKEEETSDTIEKE